MVHYNSKLYYIYQIMYLGVKNQVLLTKALDLRCVSIARELAKLDKYLILLLKEAAQKSTHYIWHAQEDDKVRTSHAANDGKIFSWDDPPETGHPGDDYGCRCWAEDYIYDPPIEPVYPIENLLAGLLGARAIALASRILNKIGNSKPEPDNSLTSHWIQRANQRNITENQALDAIESAKKSGNVVVKNGKYGTPQEHYIGSNGITVIKETSGRNAGKIITMWRR